MKKEGERGEKRSVMARKRKEVSRIKQSGRKGRSEKSGRTKRRTNRRGYTVKGMHEGMVN